ncbi:MAG: cell division protein FtsA [Candidatus Marinimicrobia bacterium]|nr:cell division protein FtsA [Candidatus Neomarinimicrobiota bacterium]
MKRVTALDIGSSSIKMAVADIDANSGMPMVRGFVKLPANGIKSGMIVDIEAATAVIYEARKTLEKSIDAAVDNCFVSISGDHITGINTSGRINTSKEHTIGLGEPDKITTESVTRVLDHTRGYGLSSDREILHLFPIEYVIDGRSGITRPEGMSGRRLEVKAHLTTYELTAVENITTCMEQAGISVSGLVLHSLASAYGVLEPEEKKRGVILIDIGAGVTDIIIFQNNAVHYTATMTMAGEMVTHDIHYLTGTTIEKAEKIKLEYGYASDEVIKDTELLKIEGIAGRKSTPIQNRELATYINARLVEILTEAQKKARNSEILQKIEPVVCLCGGTSLLRGFDTVADQVFSTSPLKPNLTRIGVPTGFTSSHMKELTSPEYACLIGLLKFGADQKGKGMISTLTQSVDLWSKFTKFINSRRIKKK